MTDPFELLDRLQAMAPATAYVEQEGQHYNIQARVPMCDFCSSQHVTHNVLADDFEIATDGTVHHWSRADWAACDACAALVRANEWEALARRAALAHPGMGLAALPIVRELHDKLRRHMKGVQPLEGHDG